MEMNRYLLAALYVMAGCAVTVPLKAQGNGEPLRGERCRLVITNTVKVISVYLEEDEAEQVSHHSLPPDYFYLLKSEVYTAGFSFDRTVCLITGTLCRTAHRIRAPGERSDHREVIMNSLRI